MVCDVSRWEDDGGACPCPDEVAPTAAPLTHDDRLGLEPGDRVLVRDDFGDHHEWEVKHRPLQLESGQWLIWLKGMSGYYALDRVVSRVTETQQEAA